MRDAARRIEFGQRAVGVGRPVAAGFGDFDESGAQGERGMAGEVGDGEHFVAQRGDQQQIDFGKDARHFVGDHAAEAVGLDEIHGGEEAGLAEDVGPGIGDLDFELVELRR